ncbi:hypothetical protein ACC691_39695, partial [Rhizobium johnstonii]|uniref:hypothetical protein n=1 Tax=Rhizobium johnstonii TaxID=3019933 RepID=UPI003F9D8384
MGSGKVFGLFSAEATFIGFLGSAIGVGIGMLVGGVVGRVLGRTLFSDLPGLQLISFTAVSVGSIVPETKAIAITSSTID